MQKHLWTSNKSRDYVLIVYLQTPWALLLTQIDFNPSMDKYIHA